MFVRWADEWRIGGDKKREQLVFAHTSVPAKQVVVLLIVHVHKASVRGVVANAIHLCKGAVYQKNRRGKGTEERMDEKGGKKEVTR